MMFEKETKKLKKLTEKLLREGDVTENEADWIYMFFRIYKATQLSAEFSADYYINEHIPKFKAAKHTFIIDTKRTSEEYMELLEQADEAFCDWYESVASIRSNEGNFISTVPTRFTYFYKNFPKDVFTKNKGLFSSVEVPEFLYSEPCNLLSGDCIYDFRNSRFLLPRYGLQNRLLGEGEYTKDISYINKMVDKLTSEGDITEEEADNIYFIYKYSQTLYVDLELPGMEERISLLEKGLARWYEAVYETIREKLFMDTDAEMGNFVYTVPTRKIIRFESFEDLEELDQYIYSALHNLPNDWEYAFVPGCPDLSDTMADVYAIKEYGGMSIYSFRCDCLRRIGFDVEKYSIEKERTWPHKGDLWLKGYPVFDYSGFRDMDKKIEETVIRLEYIKSKGVLPVGVVRNRDYYFFLFNNEDYEKIKHIFDVPDKVIKKLTPVDLDESKMQEVIDSIDIAMKKISSRTNQEEDDWTMMDR
ncbi:MAG: hypothetical protein WBK47_01090 [Acetomicrobium sp.]